MTDSEDAARLGIGGNNPPEPTLKERLTEQYAKLIAGVDDVAASADALPKKVKDADDLDRIGVVVKDAKAMSRRLDDARKAEKKVFDDLGKEVQAHFTPILDRLGRIVEILEGRATDYQREKAAEERRRRDDEARKLREREEDERRKAAAAAEAGKATAAGRAEDRANIAATKAAQQERAADASAADLTRSRGASGTLATAKTTKGVRIVGAITPELLAGLAPYILREDVEKAARTWLRVTKGTGEIPGLEVFDDVKASFR